ncbi:MAG: preprotein translocase subunit SecG [Candidatus Levybacteria bacterium]|nr:preprotein translocase subunit SecG [Candidatus Levybacteria bacterium]
MVILQILQIVAAIIVIIAILLQAQGGGLSPAFGGGGEFYRSKQSLEKVLIGVTIVSSILLAVFSVLLVIQ